jgi:hypothetical protein
VVPLQHPAWPLVSRGSYGERRRWRSGRRGGPLPVLPAEERAVELPGLRGREPRLRERLHGLVRDLPLLRRERRNVASPAQTSANVRVDPRSLSRDVVRESVQRSHLLEQRLEPLVIDRQEPRTLLPAERSSSPTSASKISAHLATQTWQTIKPASFETTRTSRSGRWDSNPRHLAWEASALPTELRPRSQDSSHVAAPGPSRPTPARRHLGGPQARH